MSPKASGNPEGQYPGGLPEAYLQLAMQKAHAALRKGVEPPQMLFVGRPDSKEIDNVPLNDDPAKWMQEIIKACVGAPWAIIMFCTWQAPVEPGVKNARSSPRRFSVCYVSCIGRKGQEMHGAFQYHVVEAVPKGRPGHITSITQMPPGLPPPVPAVAALRGIMKSNDDHGV